MYRSRKKKSVFLGTTECYSLVFFLNKKKKQNINKTGHSIIWYYIPVYAADDPEVTKLFRILEGPSNGPVF